MDSEKSMSTLATFPNEKTKKGNNTCLLRLWKRRGSPKKDTQWSLLPPPGDAAEDITNCDKMALKKRIDLHSGRVAFLSGISTAGSGLGSKNSKC